MSERPIKVAIIGGGCAGMTAAFELTRPALQGRFEVTVYQVGWRLGGKGASGRGPVGRIEEHGLHVWMGYYENAFRLMRECYQELARDPHGCPIAGWRDAFMPANFVAAADRTAGGDWTPWMVHFPPHEGLPGDPVERYRPWTIGDYLARTATLIRTLLETLADQAGPPSPASETAASGTRSLAEQLSRFLRFGALATLGAVLEAVRLLEMVLGSSRLDQGNLLLRLVDAIRAAAASQLENQVRTSDEARRLWEIADVALATLRGSMRAGLALDPRGFDALDEYDCRQWLRDNGASERSINSSFVRALYDLGFAYEDGDLSRPRIAAGAALRGALRAFFTYRGAFFWKMRAGMGDIVFAPLYETLRRRGVGFRFFHRLRDVRLGGPAGRKTFVEALTFDVQARTRDGDEYQPLVNVRGLPCWPSEPDWDQLRDGEAMRRRGRDLESHWDDRAESTFTAKVSEDFDLAVLAVGVGALPSVCPEILATNERWRAMFQHVKTVPTRALQLWLKPQMRDLGWNADPVSLSGFVEPFDTWADMSHLGPLENWPAGREPGAIAYFCSVLPEPGPLDADRVREQQARVRGSAVTFLNRDIRHLWPRAMQAPEQFRWEVLATPEESDLAGEARLDGQFWRANLNPSDRYTLTLPGSIRHRLSPLEQGYDNLTVAGDWTACGLNLGCVEAAVMSGMLAAHALSGSPPLEAVIGFDHP